MQNSEIKKIDEEKRKNVLINFQRKDSEIVEKDIKSEALLGTKHKMGNLKPMSLGDILDSREHQRELEERACRCLGENKLQ